MTGKQWLIAGALVMAAAAAPQAGSAASMSPQSTLRATGIEGSLVQKAHWNYCRRWRHECADRWGWRTRNYYRCAARHGCA